MNRWRDGSDHGVGDLEAHGRIVRREAFGRSLRGALAAAGILGAAPTAAGEEDPRFLVRNTRPLDLETPASALDGWITPNDRFFTRSHFGAPAVGLLTPWRLTIRGLVAKPTVLGLDELAALSTVTLPAVLQCAGNGRAFFVPGIPGVPWERGAVGNAEWTGVRLADLLERLGIREGASHVHFQGADRPPAPRTPSFLRSLPLGRAQDPGTILAFRMNGDPLPLLHGGPLRLVVPGWAGNHWMKWLNAITVAPVEAPGFYMQTGYRMPTRPLPAGVTPQPGDLLPLTTMNVKSLITWPTSDSKLRVGRNEVRGVAWTGTGHVTALDVSVGEGGGWEPAAFLEGPREGTWRTWRFAWDVDRPGRYRIRTRATDSGGAVQPEVTPWNRSGYLWNAIDRIVCDVR